MWRLPGGDVARSLAGVSTDLAGLEDLAVHKSQLQREGLWVPALQRHLEAGDTLPEDWKRDLITAISWELHCQETLREISEIVGRHSIPLMTFKGCALAFGTYRVRGQRVFGDIDIAVPPRFRRRVQELLEEIGFRAASGATMSRGALSLDLHDHPLHQLSILASSHRDWWSEAVPLDPELGPVLRLKNEHEFLLALLHGSKHAFSRANWVVDVLVLAWRGDSEVLAQSVTAYHAGRHLWLASRCLSEWYGAALPPALEAASRPPGALDVFTHWFARLVLARRAPDFLGMLTPVWAIPSPIGRVRYLGRALFPEDSSLCQRLKRLGQRFLETLALIG
ncbi:MAG: nucleotidyltransferase family protein [Candidatus Eremiobacteraeota bacterium]|nr:nucleotidyltransferase family protein [Candidatus Eremiobacteraeota bacterium]